MADQLFAVNALLSDSMLHIEALEARNVQLRYTAGRLADQCAATIDLPSEGGHDKLFGGDEVDRGPLSESVKAVDRGWGVDSYALGFEPVSWIWALSTGKTSATWQGPSPVNVSHVTHQPRCPPPSPPHPTPPTSQAGLEKTREAINNAVKEAKALPVGHNAA